VLILKVLLLKARVKVSLLYSRYDDIAKCIADKSALASISLEDRVTLNMAALETCLLKLWSCVGKDFDVKEASGCTVHLLLKLFTLHAHRDMLKDGVLEEFAVLKSALDCTSDDSDAQEVKDAWESIEKKKEDKHYSGILSPFLSSAYYDDAKAAVMVVLNAKSPADTRMEAIANLGRLAEKLANT
jgi:hypothetical protein